MAVFRIPCLLRKSYSAKEQEMMKNIAWYIIGEPSLRRGFGVTIIYSAKYDEVLIAPEWPVAIYPISEQTPSLMTS
jgi:hypothetical protein